MDLIHISLTSIILIVFLIHGIDARTVTFSTTPTNGNPYIGANTLQLNCAYAGNAGDSASLVTFQRKRSSAPNFQTIAEVYTPLLSATKNSTVTDTSLATRTELTEPTNNNAGTAYMKYNSLECSDQAEYRCSVTFATATDQLPPSDSRPVDLQVHPYFSSQELPRNGPANSVVEGEIVTFTCEGEVGKNPLGTYKWEVYKGNPQVGEEVTEGISVGTNIEVPENCTYKRTDTLRVQVSKEYNGAVFRCTVERTGTSDPSLNRQSADLNVLYSPRITDPTNVNWVEQEGKAELRITCGADANPTDIIYYWTKPDNSTTAGADLILNNLQIDDTGNYTCTAYNQIKGVNKTDTLTVHILVVEKTTTTTTTSTTPPSTTAAAVKTTIKPGGSTASAGLEPGAIAGIVVAVVVVIVILGIVFFCFIRKKKQEIEEPPEKPRNNQDIKFYGNRPDLVTNPDKKNQGHGGLNSSFSNSYDGSDSKLRMEDNLNYGDLTLDDRPRSRKPIQLVDPAYPAV